MGDFTRENTGVEVVEGWKGSVRGKTVLITGTTPGGTGAEAALALAHGAPNTLLLLSRSAESTVPLLQSIRTLSPSTTVAFIKTDLADLASVRAAAKEVEEKLGEGRIDVLINSAAIIGGEAMERTKDGWESCWGVNHLGHFLLTGLLVGRLVGGGRVVNVTSKAFEGSRIFWGDVNFGDGKTYDRWASYGQSKLANMLFTTALAERYGARGLTALSVHPGVINGTGLAAHVPASAFAAAWANVRKMEEETGVKFRADQRKTKEQGCATTLVAALEGGLGDHNGAHLRDCNIYEDVVPHARDKADAERLWVMSEEMVGEKFA
ncbi:Dehydrogenase reductase SDR member 13 [Trapelia coarctata]|nr:Dehydrogenase reductase SDR member 13 [Trapelia coarctata]